MELIRLGLLFIIFLRLEDPERLKAIFNCAIKNLAKSYTSDDTNKTNRNINTQVHTSIKQMHWTK